MKNLFYSLISKSIGLLVLSFVASVWVLYALKQFFYSVFYKHHKPHVSISKQQKVDIKVKQPGILVKQENIYLEHNNPT
jgi:hypothetical protein